MKVNKYVYIFLLLNTFLIPVKGNGQCTLPEIISSAEGCIDQRIEFAVETNDEVLWDFCAGELGEQPEFERIIENSRSFGRSRGMKVVGSEEKGYYLFSVNNTINELTILAFGNSLFNTPNVVQNIDISAFSPGTFDVDVVEIPDGYSAFLASSSTNAITRLDFPESLFESPEIHPLNVSFNNQVNAITIVAEMNSFFAFVSQNEMISRLEFEDGIDDISPLKVDYNIPGAGVLRKSAFLKYCDTWIGLVVGYDSDNLYQLQFTGGELKNDLNASLVTNEGSTIRFPSNLSFKWEGSSFYIHIIGALGDHYFSEVSAGQNVPSLTMTSYGKLGISNSNFALTIVKQGPFWVGFSADLSERDLIRYRFPSACDSDQEIAEGNAVLKSFNTPGPKEVVVELSGSGLLRKASSIIQINNSEAPPASFSYSSSCVQSPVSFIYTENTSDLTSIAWDFGDGSTGAGPVTEHVYNSAGTYLVTLEVNSVNACSNRIQQQIVVYDDFTAGYSTNEEIYCTNSEITLTNTISSDLLEVTTHSWFINGDYVSDSRNLTYLFKEPGNYNIELISQLGDCSSTFNDIIEVVEGPSASFLLTDACTGDPIGFTNTSTGVISSYLWDFGDGTTSTIKDPLYTYDEPGDYIVRLTVTNEAGCETSAEQLVTVHALPQASFSTELACSDLPVRFIDESFVTGANIESWQWDFGNGITSAEKNPEAVFDSAGIFPVSLTVTSTYGCETTITQDVRVLPSPESAFAYSSVCPEETVMFTDQSVPPDGESITSWAWDIGGAFSNQRNPEYTFDFSADYSVNLTVQASNQCVGISEQTISVPEKPIVQFGVENNCAGNEVLFTDLSTSENDSIAIRTWDFGGLALAGGPQASFEFPRTGTYNVTLTVETVSGCSYSGSQLITVVDSPVAAFEANPEAGAPPLEVGFTNNSEGAESYEWYINDTQVSEAVDFDYVFNDFGVYQVRLVAISAGGCRDEYMVPISVVPPEPDLEANKLLPVRDNGIITFRFTVTNKGNVTVREMPVKLILSDNISISDIVPMDLDPGASYTVILPFRVKDANYEFICAEIAGTIAGFPDTNPANNSACFTFDNAPHISALFPNPVSDMLSFRIYSDSADDFAVQIINAGGQVIDIPQKVSGTPGIFTINMDVSLLAPGFYVLRVTGPQTNAAYRFIVSR